MKKTKEFGWRWKFVTVISSLMLVLMLGVLTDAFSFVSNAQSQGKVVVRSAKIRQEANTTSDVVGSVVQEDELTINGQVTASDNTTWYQVFVDADTLGYIRADLVEITDGTTPPVTSETTTNNTATNETNTNETTTEDTNTTTPDNTNTAQVTAVEPVSATVTGSQTVRVRSNASTGSQIVTIVDSGLELTVVGQAKGTDENVWYQVKFVSGDSEMTGFIRSDYVALSGELMPSVTETPDASTEETSEMPEESQEAMTTKDWDTQYDDKWYLVDNVNAERYEITNIFDTVASNQSALEAQQADLKGQKVTIILLVILLIAMAAVITLLIFKIKDMKDSVYFAEIERETIRRRTADRPAANGKKVMHTVGAENKQTATRPAGARPTGAPTQGAQRPVGASAQGAQRPTGASTQGVQRPVGASAQGVQRPVGASAQGVQRPVGASTQGVQRPVGASTQGVQRPVGASTQGVQRPTGASTQGVQRPTGASTQGAQGPTGASTQGMQRQTGAASQGIQRLARPMDESAQGNTKPIGVPAQSLEGTRQAEASMQNGAGQVSGFNTVQQPQQDNNIQNAGWQSKNFMTDEDEFEFEFLNWDGDDE